MPTQNETCIPDSVISDINKKNELHATNCRASSGEARNIEGFTKFGGGNGEPAIYIKYDFGIKPTGDLVIIRKHSTENLKTASGILLPPVEESADTPWKGTVLAVGPGKPCKLSPAGENVFTALESLLKSLWSACEDRVVSEEIINKWKLAHATLNYHSPAVARMPMQVKVGDTVIFSRNGYQEFKIDGQLVLAMGEASILGVIEDE